MNNSRRYLLYDRFEPFFEFASYREVSFKQRQCGNPSTLTDVTSPSDATVFKLKTKPENLSLEKSKLYEKFINIFDIFMLEKILNDVNWLVRVWNDKKNFIFSNLDFNFFILFRLRLGLGW